MRFKLLESDNLLRNRLPIIREKRNVVNASSLLETEIRHVVNEEDISPVITTVQVANLVSHQLEIDESRLNNIISNPDILNIPVKVYKIAEMFILLDGNHRANAALILGRKTLKAKLFDIDSVESDIVDKLVEHVNNDYTVHMEWYPSG